MIFRCPECRTRRQDYGLFMRHLRESGHDVCDCFGYHHPHRKNSKFCKHNPWYPLHQAQREGESSDALLDIFVDIAWDTPGKPSMVCPF